MFRGGLTADLRRLIPVECTSDALRTLPPPTVLPLTVRPYTTADEEAVSSAVIGNVRLCSVEVGNGCAFS